MEFRAREAVKTFEHACLWVANVFNKFIPGCSMKIASSKANLPINYCNTYKLSDRIVNY